MKSYTITVNGTVYDVTIIVTLEDGESSLEDSMKIFEEGMKLSKYCSEKLQNAEKRIVELVNENGKITEVEME